MFALPNDVNPGPVGHMTTRLQIGQTVGERVDFLMCGMRSRIAFVGFDRLDALLVDRGSLVTGTGKKQTIGGEIIRDVLASRMS